MINKMSYYVNIDLNKKGGRGNRNGKKFLEINQPNKDIHPKRNNEYPIDNSNNLILGCFHLLKEIGNKTNKSGN
jgi:hypothetical protein